MVSGMSLKVDEYKSIWCPQEKSSTQVNQRKLEKAEAKLKIKQEKRDLSDTSSTPSTFVTREATANQMISRRDVKLEDVSRCKDIKIENFDVAFGNKQLLSGADITLW